MSVTPVRPEARLTARAISFALLGLPLAAAACQGPRWKQTLEYSRTPVAIYRDRQEEKGWTIPQGYSHPSQVEPERLQPFLAALRYQDWGLFKGRHVDPVFTVEEATLLAGPLAEALGKAGPNERVRFLVTRTVWRPLFLGAKGTSGVAFFTRPNEMNIAFDWIADTLSDETGDPRAMTFPDDPVKITGSRPELELPPGAVVPAGAPPGKVYPRWLVVNPQELAKAQPPAAPVPAAAGQQPVAVPVPISGTGASGTPATAPPSSIDAEAEAIKRKLQVLDKLLQDGTITAEEHETRRRQILLQSER